MARLGVQRDTLANMLRSHGEDDLAERAASITDDELTRIGRLGVWGPAGSDANLTTAQQNAVKAMRQCEWLSNRKWRRGDGSSSSVASRPRCVHLVSRPCLA